MQAKPHFSLVYGAGILGLSVVGILGLVGALDRCKRASRNLDRTRIEIDVLRRTLSERDDQITALNQTIASLTDEARVQNELARQATRDRDELQRRTEDHLKQLERAQTQNRTLADQLRQQTRESRIAKDETQLVKTEHIAARELLAVRTAELRGAQAYLARADTLSGSDIVGMVQNLNAEIQQTAAFMADSFTFDKSSPDNDDSEVQEAQSRAAEILGSRMVHLLRSRNHSDDPMLVQIAFQACMTAYCEWIIASWYFEDPQNERFLAEIYETMQKGEEQSVSGRWRALTRKHVQLMFNTSSQTISTELIPHFINSFIHVLLVSSVHISSKETHHRRTFLYETVVTQFSERMNVVGQHALQLNKALGEEITSGDVEAIYVPPDVEFDEITMDQTFESIVGSISSPPSSPKSKVADNGKGQIRTPKSPVLCTTDLGLHRSVKASMNGQLQWQEMILLKPKVVLETQLEQLRPNSDVQ